MSKKSTVIAAIGGFIGGGLTALALSNRRKKARRELETIVIEPDPRDEIIRKQMDDISKMVNQNLLSLEEGLDKRPWSEAYRKGDLKIVPIDDYETGAKEL